MKNARAPLPMAALAALLASVTLIAGCGGTLYQSPTTGELSQISFTELMPGPALGYVFQGDDAKACTNGKSAGQVKNGQTKTIAVPANQRIALSMMQISYRYVSCEGVVEFTPMQGKKYTFTLGPGDPWHCSFSLEEDNGKPVDFIERVSLRQLYSETAPKCAPRPE